MSNSATMERVADYSPVELQFTPDPGKDFHLLFDGMHAEEELGRPFLIRLEMSSEKLQADVAKLIGSTCLVWMYLAPDDDDDDEKERNRYFHGVVTRVISMGASGGAYRYKVELRPWIWLLSQTFDCRIFQKMKVFDIITKVFRDAHFSDFEDKRQIGAGDTELEYCVQYRESSLAFVTRLMEQYGLYYFFKFDSHCHKLVFADDPNVHELLRDAVPFEFDKTEKRSVADHIWEWSSESGLLPGHWVYQDYNFETPSADLMAKRMHEGPYSDYKQFEIFDYPGLYQASTEGNRLADVRMQEISGRRLIYGAQSNSRKLRAGWRFNITRYPDKPVNRDYLIIKSITTIGAAEGTPTPDAGGVDTYRVQFHSIPGDVPFRLQQRTPRPMIRGPQTARVVGNDGGDEIVTDEYGRVKVRFHWDHSDTRDEDRSCWIRVAQSIAGGNWGALFVPRVDQEVVVEFLEGNPDRPLITGVVYNANNKLPYTLPGEKNRSTIKTNSVGAEGFNEIRFDDTGGSEELYVHAQYDFKREIKHDEKAVIDNHRDVKITGGNDSLTIQTGNHTVAVAAGKSETSAAQSITFTVGGSSIRIDPSGVTIRGPMISLN
jgi:type VI secretion system secreted protein VgrG